jgi:hypothetical protein
MSLKEADLSQKHLVFTEFLEKNGLQKFQYQNQNHNQITIDSITEFDPPKADWLQEEGARKRAGFATTPEYTIVFDKKEEGQKVREGLSTYGKKNKWVKLYVARVGPEEDINTQWPIGRINF